jgi:hypothetical protein
MRLSFLGMVSLAATAACSTISGLDGFVLGEGGGGSTTSSAGGSTASVGGGGESVDPSGSGGDGLGNVGGSGGQPPDPECGNGIIEQGEQCDAGSVTDHCDGDCNVIGCRGQHDHLEPTTGHCYHYSDADGEIGSWQQAQSFCTSWGGELLVINDDAERDVIASLYGTLMYGNEFLWIGARDDDGDGDYTWGDGSALPSSSPWWASSPPASGCAAVDPDMAMLVASANCSGSDLNTFHLHHACERAPEGL